MDFHSKLPNFGCCKNDFPMKIVIAGAGEVGSHLAKMLSSSSETNNITVLDSNPERLEALAGTTDVLTVEGQPSSIEKLKEAGAGKADLFIAVSPAALQDVNIVSALLAKNLGAKKVAARINNNEYMKAENRLLFTSLGIDLLFYPEKVAAEEIYELLKHSASTEFMDFAQGKLQMIVFKLDDGASLIGKRPSDFAGKYDPLPFKVVAISRGGETIIPHTDTKLKMNDLLFMITKKQGVDELMHFFGKPNIKITSLMILGGGKIGEFVAASSSRYTTDIKLIELKKERCTELSEKLNGVLIVNGDGRNSDFLIDEGIKNYDAFVAVTSNTETNILACMIAKRFGVAKTIAEVENIEYIQLAKNMGVDAVINKKLITAGRIFKLTLSSKVRNVKYLSGTEAEVIEYIVNPESKITAAPLKELGFPKDAIIGGVIRGKESIIAVGDTQIMPYDKVAVFALPHAVKEVDKFFN